MDTQNSLLSNIKTAIMKKQKIKKTQVVIFKSMGGNIPGGNFPGGEDFPGGSLIGWNCPGGSFPDTPQIYTTFCRKRSKMKNMRY